MRILKNKETGEQHHAHEIDARDLVNGGLYEDLGAVEVKNQTRVMTVAELAGVAKRAGNMAVKVNITDLPEFKLAVAEAAKRIEILEAIVNEKSAKIQELEAAPSPDKVFLLAVAVALKVGAPSTMERWGVEKLTAEIKVHLGKA